MNLDASQCLVFATKEGEHFKKVGVQFVFNHGCLCRVFIYHDLYDDSWSQSYVAAPMD